MVSETGAEPVGVSETGAEGAGPLLRGSALLSMVEAGGAGGTTSPDEAGGAVENSGEGTAGGTAYD